MKKSTGKENALEMLAMAMRGVVAFMVHWMSMRTKQIIVKSHVVSLCSLSLVAHQRPKG